MANHFQVLVDPTSVLSPWILSLLLAGRTGLPWHRHVPIDLVLEHQDGEVDENRQTGLPWQPSSPIVKMLGHEDRDG